MTLEQWKNGVFDESGHRKIDAVSCTDLFACWEEVQLRELAFGCCADLTARAIANCEFKTFVRGRPEKAAYYYMLNVEPNENQSSSAFWQQVVWRLFTRNEALLVPLIRDGRLMLVVADSWTTPDNPPTEENRYRDIQIASEQYRRELREGELIHLKLGQRHVKQVLDALYSSYSKLLQSAMKSNLWQAGQHLKVHVEQVAQGQDDFERLFAERMKAQVRPFLESNSGILPEFDGYRYEMFGPGAGGGNGTANTRDIRALADDIFTFTARGLGVPPVLLLGDVAGMEDAVNHWLTTSIDPLAAQLAEELNRKLYGYYAWKRGDYVQVDTTTIRHFDMFRAAESVEKLVGSAVYSINDVREAAGGDRLPYRWADIHWMTKNISTVEQAATAAAQAAGEPQQEEKNHAELL